MLQRDLAEELTRVMHDQSIDKFETTDRRIDLIPRDYIDFFEEWHKKAIVNRMSSRKVLSPCRCRRAMRGLALRELLPLRRAVRRQLPPLRMNFRPHHDPAEILFFQCSAGLLLEQAAGYISRAKHLREFMEKRLPLVWVLCTHE